MNYWESLRLIVGFTYGEEPCNAIITEAANLVKRVGTFIFRAKPGNIGVTRKI